MLQISARLGAVAILTTMATAQVNPFVLYPQDPERQTITCTSFVGRPDWNNAAEALFELDPQHFRGVGDANGFARIFGIYHWVADERLSTSETYGLVVRNGLPAGGPDMSATGAFLQIGSLTTPPSSNTARGTWIMHDGFNIQGGLWITSPGLIHQSTYYVGIDLPANSLWPNTDGHSLFRADMLNANTGAVFGENHSAAAHDPTWAGLQNAPSFSTPWTYILGPFVTTPNLHVGGVDPSSTRLGAPGANFGMNGLYPDISGLPTTNPRSDGIVLRMTDNLAPFGLAMFGASLGWQFPYYHGPIFSNLSLIGYSHIGDGSQTVTIALSTLQNGVREINFALPGTIPAVFVGTEIVFQGISWDTNTNQAEWTNAQMAHF
ncbi:MAG: hypothetical protein H6838_01525 [Planctomycetes bacterium]|nr:hypothetical protein [Planctomycetota bacterium]